MGKAIESILIHGWAQVVLQVESGQNTLEFYSWKCYILVHFMHLWTKFTFCNSLSGGITPCPSP